MKKRNFLAALGLTGLGAAAIVYWPDQGIWNPCLKGFIPDELADHEVIRSAWHGLDSSKVWDSHVHLLGTGDNDNNSWVNPNLQSLVHPIQNLQYRFYLDSTCVSNERYMDESYVNRLLFLMIGLAKQSRLMLLAFDYNYTEKGERATHLSPFYTSNQYTARIAKTFPYHFEWIASVHPYRKDSLEALSWAIQNGSRAIKWLPAVMGIDPDSKLCDPFYMAMAKQDIPLLVHSGAEFAIGGKKIQEYGNPLLLRRPMDHGVRVIVAHCASAGQDIDLDAGEHGPKIPSFKLFARLMDDPKYQNYLFGEISAITQVNRFRGVLKTLLYKSEWHHRLINGSDYPLPGIMPLISLRQLINNGFITRAQATIISTVRQYNPLLFDFVLKRQLSIDGNQFGKEVFETRSLFI